MFVPQYRCRLCSKTFEKHERHAHLAFNHDLRVYGMDLDGCFIAEVTDGAGPAPAGRV